MTLGDKTAIPGGTGNLVTSAILTLGQAILWLALLYGLMFVVPRQVRALEDTNLQLPTISRQVIRISSEAVRHWPYVVILMVFSTTVDFGILFWMGKTSRVIQVLVASLSALVPLLLGAIAYLAMTTLASAA